MKDTNHLEETLDALEDIYKNLRGMGKSIRKQTQIFRETYVYPVIGALAAVPIVFGLAGIISYSILNNPPSPKGPQLRTSANQNTMVWSYPGEYQSRNFKDVRPFGSLDEVVLRAQDGKVITLSPSDKGFEKQEKAYNEKIVPYLQK